MVYHKAEETVMRGGRQMLINEVCKICSLTRKAVECYVEQGLAMPIVRDNGYRDFSYTEVERLKKISVLRNLGLSVSDIRAVLSGQGAENRARASGDCDSDISVHSLYMILGQKNIEIHLEREKQGLLAELARNQDWKDVQDKLHRLQKKQTVLERLRRGFLSCAIGKIGKLLCPDVVMAYIPYHQQIKQ